MCQSFALIPYVLYQEGIIYPQIGAHFAALTTQRCMLCICTGRHQNNVYRDFSYKYSLYNVNHMIVLRNKQSFFPDSQ